MASDYPQIASSIIFNLVDLQYRPADRARADLTSAIGRFLPPLLRSHKITSLSEVALFLACVVSLTSDLSPEEDFPAAAGQARSLISDLAESWSGLGEALESMADPIDAVLGSGIFFGRASEGARETLTRLFDTATRELVVVAGATSDLQEDLFTPLEISPSGFTYTVLFGTNRAASDTPGQFFGGARSGTVSYGTCDVFVPFSHKVGSLGSSAVHRVLAGLDDRLSLLGGEVLKESDFWEYVFRKVGVAGDDAVVLIPGFNTSFVASALRAAQMGVDLGVRGPMAFFSWPSLGQPTGYLADEASIEASAEAIAAFISNFANDSTARKVHVIAYSMGNRGLAYALKLVRHKLEGKRQLGQIILAAPDIDVDVFKKLAADYTQISERTTLYVSPRDRAVEASSFAHGFPRVGFMPPVTVVEPIETVDVGAIDVTILGHGYVAEARPVLTDIFQLLKYGAAPSDRFGLSEVMNDDDQLYWRIQE